MRRIRDYWIVWTGSPGQLFNLLTDSLTIAEKQLSVLCAQSLYDYSYMHERANIQSSSENEEIFSFFSKTKILRQQGNPTLGYKAAGLLNGGPTDNLLTFPFSNWSEQKTIAIVLHSIYSFFLCCLSSPQQTFKIVKISNFTLNLAPRDRRVFYFF